MEALIGTVGFVALAAIILTPIIGFWIFGRRHGQATPKRHPDWAKDLEASPDDFISPFVKTRSK